MKSAYLLLLVFLLPRCRPEEGTMNGDFWTRHDGGGPYYLYFNDTLKGQLPVLQEAPRCGDIHLDKQTIFILLTSGTHKITVKDQQGNIVLSEEYAMKKSSGHFSLGVSINSPGGNNQHVITGDCSLEELSF